MATARKPAAKTAVTKNAAGKQAAAKKPAAKKSASKAAASDGSTAKRAPNPAFMAAVKPSAALAAIVGEQPMPRTEITRKLWDYIKENKLQDPSNRRMINADDKLKPIFGKPQVSMFEMTSLVNKQVS